VCTEVKINRKQLGQEFDKVFKESMEETMICTSKTAKRKRNCIETNNDLNYEEQIIVNREKWDEEEEEEWVAMNSFALY
jgi:hypothetical protein